MLQRHDKLQEHLSTIQKYFNHKIVLKHQQEKEIKKYYLSNHLAYLLFHNRRGFMHMGISKTKKYRHKDLLEPLNIIQGYIHKIKAQRVLELGPGNGVNSIYLAKKNEKLRFEGIDLSKQKTIGSAPHYHQQNGDFHNLSRYEDNTFDVVFVIEALCHSTKKDVVLNEVSKKLKKGGYFIILDAYSLKFDKELTKEEGLAKNLVSKSMAVDSFEHINDFDKKIEGSKFKVVEKVNLSKKVMPSLKRFERKASLFYKYPIITRLFFAVLPQSVVQNSIAALLMPALIEREVGGYYLYALQRR